MAEKYITHPQHRTKEANLVIPLDEVRTVDHGFKSIASGAFPTSGIIYTIASGKEAYVKQIIATPTIDAGGVLELAEVISGGYSQIATINIASGETKVIDTFIGPVTSGFTVMSGTSFAGDITLIVQIDPKATE